jgi:membrane dipeptidase
MTRPFRPGEAWAAYRMQVDHLAALGRHPDVEILHRPEDLAGARRRGAVGAILGVEGADFVENDLDRVHTVFADGVRVLTLVHFARGGPIGDVATDTPVHGGLTRFGRDVVRELHRAGVLVDLAHASERTAFDVLDVAERPLLISHTDLDTLTPSHPRFVSVDLAAAVAAAGGVIGAWPAGIALRSLADYADRIVDLVDRLGSDHVGLGTDMDANYRAVLPSYARMPLLVVALRRRGMDEATLDAVLGGNFLRVMAAALAP